MLLSPVGCLEVSIRQIKMCSACAPYEESIKKKPKTKQNKTAVLSLNLVSKTSVKAGYWVKHKLHDLYNKSACGLCRSTLPLQPSGRPGAHRCGETHRCLYPDCLHLFLSHATPRWREAQCLCRSLVHSSPQYFTPPCGEGLAGWRGCRSP